MASGECTDATVSTTTFAPVLKGTRMLGEVIAPFVKVMRSNTIVARMCLFVRITPEYGSSSAVLAEVAVVALPAPVAAQVVLPQHPDLSPVVCEVLHCH